MESIKKEMKNIEINKDIINKAKNYKIKTSKPEIKKIDLPSGIHTTTCLNCNNTCHNNCAYADDNDKKRCIAMDKTGNCHECKGKCFWNMHKNTPYKIVYEIIEVETTIEELKKKYCDAKSQYTKADQIINGMENNLNIIRLECLEMQENIINNLNILKKIALKVSAHETLEEYLKLMIINEKNEKNEGYLDKIKCYEELQKQNDIIKILFKKQSIIEEFDKFKKDYLYKKKKELLEQINNKEDINCIIK